MKCWKCGTDISKGTKTCSSCGVSLVRTKPSTDAGKALRMIFDDFGHEKVLGDPRYIMTSLTDLLPDPELLIYKIEHVYHVGLGSIYEAQIKSSGKPDQPFYTHVRRVLTEDVGFSDNKTDELITYFDEMVGWERPQAEKAPETKVKQSAVASTPAKPVTSSKTAATSMPDSPAPVKRSSTVKAASVTAPKSKSTDSEFSSMYEAKNSDITSKIRAKNAKARADKSNSTFYYCDCGFKSKGYKNCPNCGKPIVPASKPADPAPAKTDSSLLKDTIKKIKSTEKTTKTAKNNVPSPSRNNPTLFNYLVCECGYSTYNKSVPYCPRCGKRLKDN